MSNPKTTWTFTYYSTNSGNKTLKLYKEKTDGIDTTSLQIGGSGDAHDFKLANPDYAYPRNNNDSSWFDAGTFHGYTIWARSVNGGALSSAADGEHYSMSQASELYLIRKSGMKVLCDGTVGAVDGNTVTNGIIYDNTFYDDILTLPTTVTRAADNDKYTFGGWYATSDFSGNPITHVTMDDRDMQVFAKWIPKDITLTYHPEYPDVNDNSAIFTETAKFNREVGALHQFTTAENGRILVDSTGTYYRYRPDGEDRDSTYRFDGWWRKDPVTGKYTVQVTGSEVLYDDNTDVYARWTQVAGYAYLKIRCVQVDNTSIVHEEMSAHKILLGSPQYIYAPLVNAATWNQPGEDWSGYYPTQTRVTQTFYGEEPEIVFYYSKGTALNYTVNYFVTFKPYGTTGGSDEEITLKTQEYIQSVNSAVVVPPFFDGYYLTNDVTSVPVANNESGKIIDFYYEPDLRTIQMVAKTLYGSHQSFPEIVVDDLKSIFDLYPTALAGYELVPMYKLYDLQGNEITPDYILASEKDFYMQNLPNGTYRALGRVYLQKDGVNLMVLWDSPNYVNFMMVNDDGE